MADLYSNPNNENSEMIDAMWLNTLTQIVGNSILLNQFPPEYQQIMMEKVVKATCKHLDNEQERENAESLASNVIL